MPPEPSGDGHDTDRIEEPGFRLDEIEESARRDDGTRVMGAAACIGEGRAFEVGAQDRGLGPGRPSGLPTTAREHRLPRDRILLLSPAGLRDGKQPGPQRRQGQGHGGRQDRSDPARRLERGERPQRLHRRGDDVTSALRQGRDARPEHVVAAPAVAMDVEEGRRDQAVDGSGGPGSARIVQGPADPGDPPVLEADQAILEHAPRPHECTAEPGDALIAHRLDRSAAAAVGDGRCAAG
jgi:hypothetical protein